MCSQCAARAVKLRRARGPRGARRGRAGDDVVTRLALLVAGSLAAVPVMKKTGWSSPPRCCARPPRTDSAREYRTAAVAVAERFPAVIQYMYFK